MSSGAGAASDQELAARIRGDGAVLLDALERHAPGARLHAGATGTYAYLAALGLGVDRPRAEAIREAAKLHEVGRLYAAQEEHGEPAPEPDEDSFFEEAAGLLRGAGIDDRVADWILRTRERYDGAGPEGMSAGAIPLESRLVKGACRAARLAAGADVAAAADPAGALRAEAGRALDPEVANALAAVLERSGG